jgi:anti-sigma B factor antagonist
VRVRSEVVEGVATVLVEGEVDASNAGELRDAFLALLGDGAQSMVIDCSRLEFIDSMGLGAIISANKAAGLQFGTVTIRNASAMVLRLLEITGLDERLHIER